MMQRTMRLVDRRPVVLIGLAVAFSLFGDVTIYAVLPIYREALGLSPVEVGILLSANRWVRLVTNQIARRVLERRRPQKVFAVALLAGSLITLSYAASPPFLLFLLARMAWGAVWSFIRHTGVMTTIGAGSPERAAGALGIYHGAVEVGYIAGTVAGAALFDVVGFAAAFSIMAVISAAGVAFDYLGFRHLRPRSGLPAETRPEPPPRDATTLLRGFVTTCVGVGLIVSTLGFTLQQRFGDSVRMGPFVVGIATLNGALIALHYAINSAGSPMLGALVDRLGRRPSEIIAFTVGTAALGAAALFPGSPALLPLVVVFFLVNVASRLSLTSRAGLQGPASFSRFMTAADLGAAVGPLVGWLVIEQAGSPDAVFAIGTVLYGVAALTAMRRSPLVR